MQTEIYKGTEADWLKEQRKLVQKYLDKEEVRLVKILQRPVWFVSPYVAIWKTRSLKPHAQNKLWIISGDLPTDYYENQHDLPPREIMFKFAERWKSISKEMLKGKQPINFKIGKLEDQKNLGSLLNRRARILLRWSKDDSIWL